MPYPRRVETERLALRAWEPRDFEALRAIWADPDVAVSLSPNRHLDPDGVARDELNARLRGWEQHGFDLWAAVELSSSELIGWIGAWRQNVAPALDGEVEVGWTLRRPWWGFGLASEGAGAAVASAFAELPVDRIVHLIHPANERSIAVARRLGSTLTGTTPHARVPGLELGVYSLDRSTFDASPQSRSSR